METVNRLALAIKMSSAPRIPFGAGQPSSEQHGCLLDLAPVG
jgi:hypothetical protein